MYDKRNKQSKSHKELKKNPAEMTQNQQKALFSLWTLDKNYIQQKETKGVVRKIQ